MASQKEKKGKGKQITRKQQILEEKIQTLTQNLNPIPFIPLKILHFRRHETLLRNLGLWDFIKIDFDKNLNKDLIVECVANYESRYTRVNRSRIAVNSTELARAFKMHIKKEKLKDKAGYVKPLCAESIAFMKDFMLYWILLHEDMWVMPDEVMKWSELIKEGHPEKVDWAGMIWFMMEKELIQGENLKNCYYAAHLQYLMKEQKVFMKEEEELALEVKEIEVKNLFHATERLEGLCIELNMMDMKVVNYEKCKDSHEEELVLELKKVDVEDFCETNVKVDDAIELEKGPTIDLKQGEDVENEEKMVDYEKCKDSHEEELAFELKKVDVEDFCETNAKVDDATELEKGPTIDLKQGEDVENEEKMVDYEKCKDSHEDELAFELKKVDVEDFCETNAKVDDATELEKGPAIDLKQGEYVEKEEKMVDYEMCKDNHEEEFAFELKKVDVEDFCETNAKVDDATELEKGPTIDLKQGEDAAKEEKMVDYEKCKDNHEEELAFELKKVDVEDFCETNAKVDDAIELEKGPTIDLKQGEDVEKEEKMVDLEMVDYEKCKDSHEEELAFELKKVDVEDFCETNAKVDDVTELKKGPTIDLKQGEDVEKEDKMVDLEMVDYEKCKDSHEELAFELKKVDVEDLCEADAQVDATEREKSPSIGLTLGKNVEKEERMVNMEMVDYEKCKYSEKGGGEEKLGQWLMQHCSNAPHNQKIFDEGSDEEKEIKEKCHRDAFLGEFTEIFPENQIASETRIGSQSSLGNNMIQHDLISHRNKKLRMDDSCKDIEDFEQKMYNINILYEQKHQAVEEIKLKIEIALEELKRRDKMIELLNKIKSEELEKKDKKIFEYEKEVLFMGSVLNGYKKVVEGAQRQFAEYREKVRLPEESAYKVVGPGGLMLSVGEIERNRYREMVGLQAYRVGGLGGLVLGVGEMIKESENSKNEVENKSFALPFTS